ncbi:MAG: tyrosine-type recombinase/integrase [Pirellulaceae bacterium]
MAKRLAKHGPTRGAMSWDEFRIHYEDTHLAGKAKHTRTSAASAMNWLEKTIGSARDICLIDSTVIARMVATWRRDGMKDSTIRAHLGHVRAAFGWAYKMQLIQKRPIFPMPSQAGRFMRGRPLSVKEFRQLLRACRTERPKDWRQWVRFLRGLWYSGLRLEEATRLSWDEPPLRVDLAGGRFPRLVIHAPGQKARRDELVPIARDFATWLRRTPAAERHGRVLPIFSTWGDDRPVTSVERIGSIVADIGRASGLVVNDEGKHASAHDLRRSFGTRWAAKVKPLALKRLMRHTSIETTLRYYVDQDADDVAEELWA